VNSQEFYAAATVYHEARGESIDGQIACAHVIFNRALARHLSVKEVVYQPEQFSCYNEDKEPSITNYKAFVIAQEAVNRARDERLRGLSFSGADHYLNPYLVIETQGKLPEWVEGMERVAIIGRHHFYRSG